jgi:hypothetical protein
MPNVQDSIPIQNYQSHDPISQQYSIPFITSRTSSRRTRLQHRITTPVEANNFFSTPNLKKDVRLSLPGIMFPCRFRVSNYYGTPHLLLALDTDCVSPSLYLFLSHIPNQYYKSDVRLKYRNLFYIRGPDERNVKRVCGEVTTKAALRAT